MKRDNKDPESIKETIPFILIISMFFVTALESFIFLKFTTYMTQLPVYFAIFAVFFISYSFMMYSSVKDGLWSKKRAIIQCVLITIMCLLFCPVPILRGIIEIIMLLCIHLSIVSLIILWILEIKYKDES